MVCRDVLPHHSCWDLNQDQLIEKQLWGGLNHWHFSGGSQFVKPFIQSLKATFLTLKRHSNNHWKQEGLQNSLLMCFLINWNVLHAICLLNLLLLLFALNSQTTKSLQSKAFYLCWYRKINSRCTVCLKAIHGTWSKLRSLKHAASVDLRLTCFIWMTCGGEGTCCN